MAQFLKGLLRIKWLSPLKIALIITVSFMALFLWVNVLSNVQIKDVITSIDRKIVDYILRYRALQPTTNKVALITIDAKSIKQIGRWPWPRNVIKDGISALNDYYGVSLIGFDIVFSEPDQTYTMLEDSLTSLPPEELTPAVAHEILKERNFDYQLAGEINGWDNIVCGYFFRNDLIEAGLDQDDVRRLKSYIDPMKIPLIVSSSPNIQQAYIHEAEFPEINIFSSLMNNNYKAGFFSVTPDPDDGVVRRVESIYRLQGDYYPSLPIKMYQTYLAVEDKDVYNELLIEFDESGMIGLGIGERFYSTDSDGTFLINFRGPQQTIEHFSFVDVLAKKYPKEALQGKLVIVGVTELGVFDIRSTPVGSTYPGLEVQGTVLDNLLQDDFLIQNNTTKFLSLILILFVGLAVGLIKKYNKSLTGDFLVLFLILAILGLNYYLLNEKYLVLSTAYPVFTAGINWFVILIYITFSEGKDKRFIKSAFSQYLAPKVIDRLLADPSQLKLGGLRKKLTIMFTDLKGFSSISETTDIFRLTAILNEYLTMMVDIIMKHEGTVDKFEGDAIIAFWGAPVDSKKHAEQACRAVIEMQKVMVEFRKRLLKEKIPAFIMRVGINTGQVMVGNFGSRQRMDYTVIGDAANLAARLEGVNKIYGTQTMISDNTRQELPPDFEMRQLDEVQVVGKKESIRIYELQDLKGKAPALFLERNRLYENAYSLYRQKKWNDARLEFEKVLQINPDDHPSEVFIGRIDELLKMPAEQTKLWDGIYRLTSK